jgi:hypothetical protein
MRADSQPVHYNIDDTPEGLRVVLPARRKWGVMLFCAVWLGGWFLGEEYAIQGLRKASEASAIAFLVFWLLGWNLAGVGIASMLLWRLAGREIIGINLTTLSYRWEALGLGRTREFPASQVRQVRVVDYPSEQEGFVADPVTIEFDCGAETFRMDCSLMRAEAEQLIGQLSARLPRKLDERKNPVACGSDR